jgi:hypothetical protein
MYGKAFESMYSGSMVGSSLNVFAVWNYVIAKMRMGVVEINPKILAFILGGEEKEIERAIEFLCSPDPKSRSKEEDGRRLVQEGQFQYRVVNWAFYESIKNENDRREYNRNKQREYRLRKKLDGASVREQINQKVKPEVQKMKRDLKKSPAYKEVSVERRDGV